MHSSNVLKLRTVEMAMDHWRGGTMLLRLAIVIMLAALLSLSGCSSDDGSQGVLVNLDDVVTGTPDNMPVGNQRVLTGLAFEGNGSQFGFGDFPVELSFYLNDAGELRYDMDELDSDGEFVRNIFMGGMVEWNIMDPKDPGAGATGRCTFQDNLGVTLDTTANECTITVTSDVLCDVPTTACAGSLALSADALDDSDDVNINLLSNGNAVVNGVTVGNVND